MRKELKFIHITKTGGSSIEECAKKKGILFGVHDPVYMNPPRCKWHPHHAIFTKLPIEVRRTYDWFTVVRNPYDRIISEYYCKWGGIGLNYSLHTKEECNTYTVFISDIVSFDKSCTPNSFLQPEFTCSFRIKSILYTFMSESKSSCRVSNFRT